MASLLSRVTLGVSAGVAMLIVPGSAIGDTPPGAGPSTPANASPRATARKLAGEGIAAQEAKDYSRAIALYLKAFSLEPSPLLLFNVGQVYRLAGCFERAVLFYERYLALEPKGREAANARVHLADVKRAARADDASCAKIAAADEEATRSPVTPMGRLKLRSVPDGVTVMLDGVKIGATPIERELAAGAHTVALVDSGMLVGERTVEISADETAELTVPVERPTRNSRPERPSRVAPVLLWAGGGLLFTGSGLLFYLGQKGGQDHPEDRYIYRGAMPTGFVLAGAGAAAVGVGVWLWVRGSRESAPVASIGHGGGYLGWQGRF